MKKLRAQNIAFFTQTNDFDEHFTFLRRRGINVFKVDEKSEIENISFIIMDLVYEDDRAYDFINQINYTPGLSQINVFVVVRSHSEINKLSSLQNIRIIDYLSAKIDPEEFVSKVISALDFDKQPSIKCSKKNSCEN